MSLWDKPPEKSSGSGGDFLRLQDGEERTLAVLPGAAGDPVEFLARPFAEGEAPKRRILVAVYSVEDKGPKIIDMARSTFTDFAAVAKKFPRDKWTYTYSRSGSGKATEYRILPSSEITPERAAKLAQVKAPDLVALVEAIRYREPAASAAAPASRPAARPAPQVAPAAPAAEVVVADEDIPF